jgi:cell volume regulation protein A
MEASSELILLGGLLLLLSVFAGAISARLGAPLLLAFLGLGMLAGEDGPGHIRFDDFRTSYLIGSLALAIILFDGGLATRWNHVKQLMVPSALLATVGVAVTAGIVGATAHYGFAVPWPSALLVGAVVAPTDAAAVVSVLQMQKLGLRPRVAAVLELESGFNDPMAVFATLALIEVIQHGATVSWAHAGELFGIQLLGGIAIGVAGGSALLFLFRKLNLDPGLYSVLGLAGAMTAFGGAQLVEASGFLATYLAALILGNGVYAGKEAVVGFFGSFAWLSQIVLFLMLGLLVTPHELVPAMAPAFAVAGVLILIARPFAVALCLIPFRYNWREILFISWVGLRGAVPIYLTIIPVLNGAESGPFLFGTTFIVVMISLVIQGWTVAPVARWLKLSAAPEAD